MDDAPLNGKGAATPQKERGNQMGGSHGSASGRDPSKSGFRASPSPSASMGSGGTISKQGTVGATRKDTGGKVITHNPYPNGIA